MSALAFLLETALFVLALAALALAAFYALEVLAAFLPPRVAPTGPRPPLAVVVPAHDEAAGLAGVLENIRAQLWREDRLVVVADNCSDDTASVASGAGAEVLIRNEPARRGKGYALQFALDALKPAPPSIVVFIDADCRLRPGALDRVAAAAAASGRPAQALYLMRAPDDAPAPRRAAEFAWLVMNRVRMAGLARLFDVTRLTGTGMALPWALAAELDLASCEIVEDLALSAALIERGAPPLLVLDAVVESDFPKADDSAVLQRARWEHGSLRLAWRRAPGLLAKAARRRDARLAAAALDLLIPPLALFAAAVGGLCLVGLAPLAWSGASAPFYMSCGAMSSLIVASAAAWVGFGRDALPPAYLPALAGHALDKFRVYSARARLVADVDAGREGRRAMSGSARGSRVGHVAIGRNEGARLVACLDSLARAGGPVVYVDSGSTDDSIAAAEAAGASVVRLDPTIPFTAARARNAGFARLMEVAPDADYVQFVDGDCALVDGWVDSAAAFLDARPDVAVVCGRRRERNPQASVYNRLCDAEWDTPAGEALACGGDALMRSRVFEDAGGFRDDLIAGEEPELCLRLRQAGWRIWRLEAEMTLHDAAMTRFSQWWRRSVRAGHAYAEISDLHRGAPLRIWAREARRALVWAGVAPAAFISAAAHPAFLSALTIYPAQIMRLTLKWRNRYGADALVFSCLSVLGKFAETVGILRYWANRMRGARSRLVEYKALEK
ncbi:glycosyltransferase [Amphiplicatus metriothermophilus]|uniref:Glycosyltransferase, catalytic subunit of cellulose synthase and poly-beta-1,6-N-acetylglucosamine synthase n=1 Tax=Amphiplicatus metriothermophilus TaxID=1519374 RepID=A0A239PJ73_9PROT|nr:glycosyltransferase [Amphiplicatus metriothermophilus]MBB5517848.1 glycosyltransferase involved in cell wall biosynthesis [Amphiplicatus metriothermophilus]SNT67818.1 Glycosyltransferase, catalytic subunit of cellulose synthase and poly-beta-1,6-N-acetylglucosamine synthase [Amphiplicatus metriothermophilus]